MNASRRSPAILLLLWLASVVVPSWAFASEVDAARAFSTVEIYLDPEGEPLAAYQLTLQTSRPDTRLVGVEGGRGGAFAEPPHYDPGALRGGLIKLAALQIEGPLPTQRVHVATLHVEHAASEAPRLIASEVLAVDTDGGSASVEFSQEIGD